MSDWLKALLLWTVFALVCICAASIATSDGQIKCLECTGSKTTCTTECSGNYCIKLESHLPDGLEESRECLNHLSEAHKLGECLESTFELPGHEEPIREVTCVCASDLCNSSVQMQPKWLILFIVSLSVIINFT